MISWIYPFEPCPQMSQDRPYLSLLHLLSCDRDETREARSCLNLFYNTLQCSVTPNMGVHLIWNEAILQKQILPTSKFVFSEINVSLFTKDAIKMICFILSFAWAWAAHESGLYSVTLSVCGPGWLWWSENIHHDILVSSLSLNWSLQLCVPGFCAHFR